MPQTILVVDDDHAITRLVRAYLEQASFQVSSAHDAASALRMVRTERPDLLVLDLMLPDRDGLDLARALRADPTTAGIPIIMLTARIDPTDRIVGLELGADDYVPKPFDPRELVARVRAVLRRSSGQAAPAQRLQHGDLSLDLDAHRLSIAGATVELTPTEFDLLALLLRNPGRAFTRAELVEHGLGYAYAGMERTVDSHIKNLRKKIERDPTAPPLIETVYGIGYRLRSVEG